MKQTLCNRVYWAQIQWRRRGEGDRESRLLKETWKWRIMCESEVWSWAQCSKKTFHHLRDQLKKLIKFARGAALLSDSVSVLNNAARLLLLQNLHLIILTSSAAVRRQPTELSWSGLNKDPRLKPGWLSDILCLFGNRMCLKKYCKRHFIHSR